MVRDRFARVAALFHGHGKAFSGQWLRSTDRLGVEHELERIQCKVTMIPGDA